MPTTLDALPIDILHLIASCFGDENVASAPLCATLHLPSRHNIITRPLYSLCLTSKRLHEAATPQLYRAISVTKGNVPTLASLLCTVLENPTLARCIERLDVDTLDLFGKQLPSRMSQIAHFYARKETRRRLRRRMSSAVASILLLLAPGITTLNVCGYVPLQKPPTLNDSLVRLDVALKPFMTTDLQQVVEAIQQSTNGIISWRNILRNLRLLRVFHLRDRGTIPVIKISTTDISCLANLPPLRCLSIAGAEALASDTRWLHLNRSSRVTRLDLLRCGMPIGDIVRLVPCFEALEAFQLEWSTIWAYRAETRPWKHFDSKQLVQALRLHRGSLKKFSLYFPWESGGAVTTMLLPGALANFTKLESLVLHEELFCTHDGRAIWDRSPAISFGHSPSDYDDVATALERSLPPNLVDLQIIGDNLYRHICEVTRRANQRRRLASRRLSVTFAPKPEKIEFLRDIQARQARGELSFYLADDGRPSTLCTNGYGSKAWVMDFGERACEEQIQWFRKCVDFLAESYQERYVEKNLDWYHTTAAEGARWCLENAWSPPECMARLGFAGSERRVDER